MDFIVLHGGVMKKAFVLAFLLVTAIVYKSSGTHLRAGDITVTRIGCGRTFLIKITAYTNTKNTNVQFGGDGTAILNFGDGNIFEVPIVPNTPRPDLDPDGSIATASYSIEHTFSSDGQYTISYKEPNRNQGVLNMDNSVETEFYIETLINIDPYFGCNSSPVLPVPPIDKGCVGVTWFHNAGAYDVDGDSLSYELVVPNQDRNLTVTNYKSPADRKFYLSYETGNESKNGRPTFTIDPISGTLTWDAPGTVGEFNVAFNVIEWRRVGGVWIKMGYVRRDMQIIIDDCKNKRPDIKIPKDTCIEAGTTLKAKIIATDPDVANKVKIEAFSQIFNYASAQSPATISPYPPDFRTQPSILDFEWNTKCLHIRDQPYQVVFKVTDNGAPRLATFKTWFIKVVAPAPKWDKIQLSLAKRQTDLEWKSYLCNKEAEKMQIWRRVDKIDFKPDNCQTGMPDLGYTLIAEVPLKDINNNPVTKYIDNNDGKGLAPGAKYCYRLVAAFPLPSGGESYVSIDTCIGPILADAPIITNVSVAKTNSTAGQILVRWTPPYDANSIQFPKPYKYQVYRGSTLISTVTDTTFVDSNLNTEENTYNYFIIAKDANNVSIDTSAVASSVRLETLSQNKQIELNWHANVPWSNQIQKYPWHLIYRGPEGSTESSLVLIDSVNASIDGFNYVDKGQYQNTPLKDGEIYCYRILTRGGYGNNQVKDPLENFSQIICAQPGDTIPPCKPQTPSRSTLDYVDCEDYFHKFGCNNNIFRNILYWAKPQDAACRADVYGYKIFVSSSSGGSYDLLDIKYLTDDIIRDTFFIDTLTTSYARCYKIAAVDRSGNIGELSDPVCFDNCPYYELPNVFTPNNDSCNDLFSAYSDRIDAIGEGSGVVICHKDPEEKQIKCARFVTKVTCKIYNRWGKEVYSYEGRDDNDKNTIYIDWNGKSSDGVDLATGVYYYMAEVTFQSVDPAKRSKILKGWVHLLR